MRCPTCNQEYPIDVMTFGGRLKEMRIAAGMTAKELGVAVGYKSGSQITRWEEGSASMPDSIAAIAELAEALGCEFLYLMMGTAVSDDQIEGQGALPGLREPIDDSVMAVDWSGPMDRAGRPMRYTDGSEIPIGLRPTDPPEGVVIKRG